ncbi:polysaccharide deacetylase family protein [Ophiocordyceps camponoti-floridani]|uniref:Polysaccharide deacetylase family protein n=1 Tax=Ophiocordyceps camponoti-floridani TaxID=2030778 RepID=A0A8H4Q2B6_9HYPO|nr:polysaccharide deacetylase family protein [Ophiocordyceps camponoti-floridani]
MTLPLLLVGALLSLVVRAEQPVWLSQLKGNTSVPFGTIITKCTVANTFALTFDDGPFDFTPGLLKTLREQGAKATFFVNGDNLSKIEDQRCVLRQMVSEGHQIGSHGFQHKDLSLLDDRGIVKQIIKLEAKLLDPSSIQMAPTYMRPPFFSTDDRVLAVMKRLEYHVVQADVDTKDFEFKTEDVIGPAVTSFQQGLGSGGSISLMHDINGPTVSKLVPEALKMLKKQGKKLVTVGECLGDPPKNWYRVKDGTKDSSLNCTLCKDEKNGKTTVRRDEIPLDAHTADKGSDEPNRTGKSARAGKSRGGYSIRSQLDSAGDSLLAENSNYIRGLIRQ